MNNENNNNDPFQQGINLNQGMNMPQQGINPNQGMNMPQQGINPNQGMNMPQQGMNLNQGMNISEQQINPNIINEPINNINNDNKKNIMAKIKALFQKKQVIYIAISLLVFLTAGITWLVISSNFGGYNKVINSYCTALSTLDTEVYKSLFPQEILDVDDFEESIDTINEAKETLESFNAQLTVSCKKMEKAKLNKEELKIENDNFKSLYDAKRDITKAYDVKLKINTKTKLEDKQNENSEEQVVTVGKIDGKWYLINLN